MQVERHCETNHKWLLEKSEEERKEYIKQELKKTLQSKNLLRCIDRDSNLVSSNFSLSHSIVKQEKPFCEEEFLKTAFMECAFFLFDDIQNKAVIIKLIEELHRRVIDDATWLSNLMFFTDLSIHLNELNVKL